MLRIAARLGPMLFLISGALPADAPHTTTLAETTVRIPFDSSRRYIAVQVELNGRGPFDFHVDTYASSQACIDRKLVERLGLKRVGSALNSDGSGKLVRTSLVRIDELVLGGATFEGVTALVDDYSWVPSPSGRPIDGLLGFALFSELLLRIDYPRRLLELQEGRLEDGPDDDVFAYSAPREAPDFDLHIGETTIRVGIDTGCQAALMLPDRFREELELAGRPRKIGQSRTAYSLSDIYSAPLREPLTLAGAAFERLPVIFRAETDLPLVGYDLLKNFVLTFDQKRKLVRFDQGEQPVAELTREGLEEYVGTYRVGRGDVRAVTRRGKRLYSQRTDGPRLEVIPDGLDRFRFRRVQATAVFLRDDDGEVVEMILYRDGEPASKAKRVSDRALRRF